MVEMTQREFEDALNASRKNADGKAPTPELVSAANFLLRVFTEDYVGVKLYALNRLSEALIALKAGSGDKPLG